MLAANTVLAPCETWHLAHAGTNHALVDLPWVTTAGSPEENDSEMDLQHLIVKVTVIQQGVSRG